MAGGVFNKDPLSRKDLNLGVVSDDKNIINPYGRREKRDGGFKRKKIQCRRGGTMNGQKRSERCAKEDAKTSVLGYVPFEKAVLSGPFRLQERLRKKAPIDYANWPYAR